MVREVYQSERWESLLRSLSKFYDYSLGNTILIAMQMPTGTHVASFRSWKRDFNRYVKKDALLGNAWNSAAAWLPIFVYLSQRHTTVRGRL